MFLNLCTCGKSARGMGKHVEKIEVGLFSSKVDSL